MEADNVLTGALRQLFAVAEAYPDLKANTNFTQLQSTLEDTENKVSYARQSYNDCVLSYNNAIQTFPAVIFAGIFQFKERQGFEAAEAPARHQPSSSSEPLTHPQPFLHKPPRRMHTSTGRFPLSRGPPQGAVHFCEYSACPTASSATINAKDREYSCKSNAISP